MNEEYNINEETKINEENKISEEPGLSEESKTSEDNKAKEEVRSAPPEKIDTSKAGIIFRLCSEYEVPSEAHIREQSVLGCRSRKSFLHPPY